MHKDVAKLCKYCIDLQQSKISRHVTYLPEQFVTPDGRFDHVHMDIIGPMPESKKFKYCVTMIDRFSRWAEAVPIRYITDSTIVRVFYDSLIDRFGSSKIITADQDSQFKSELFTVLLS